MSNMKIILVAGCSNCPHGAQWNLEGTEYMCGKKTKINPDKNIPEWCPLMEAAEFLKKVNSQKQL